MLKSVEHSNTVSVQTVVMVGRLVAPVDYFYNRPVLGREHCRISFPGRML